MHSTTMLAGVMACLWTLVNSTPININPPTNFFLVTTTQANCAGNSSLLANVSATSLFDAYETNPYLLRLIGPGYESLPQFNLTKGRLNSFSHGPFDQGPLNYRSAPLVEGQYLSFYPQKETGSLALREDHLLTVDGEAEGWAICTGPLEQSAIAWKASNESCVPTYIQAVAKPPY